MNKHRNGILTLLLYAATIGSVAAQMQTLAYQTRKYYGAKMELEDGIMHAVGQLGAWKGEQQGLNGYLGVVGEQRPCIFMVYAGVKRDTMPHPEHLHAALDTIAAMEQRNENTKLIPQMGLYIVDFVDALESNASYNMSGFDSLVAIMNESQRPWYVRIGYEFNGGWNGYQPEAYQKAYKLISDLFTEKATVPVANVWCYHPTNANHMDYYPGDSVVDWWAIDLFEEKYLTGDNTLNFLQEADDHGKPVMIGEATPKDGNVDDGREDWDSWFDPYFQLLADNPGIKVSTYINWDWSITRWPGWGETRIETSDTISSLWAEEISNPIFRHGPYEAEWFDGSTEIHRLPAPGPTLTPETGLRIHFRKTNRDLPAYNVSGRRLKDIEGSMIMLQEKPR